MARSRQIIETVTCDVCGQQADDATTVVLGWGGDRWELDLCETDRASLSAKFDEWTSKGRRSQGRSSGSRSRSGGSSRRRPSASDADWEYLESLGFKRHRGRKTMDEIGALENRPK